MRLNGTWFHVAGLPRFGASICRLNSRTYHTRTMLRVDEQKVNSDACRWSAHSCWKFAAKVGVRLGNDRFTSCGSWGGWPRSKKVGVEFGLKQNGYPLPTKNCPL